LILASGEMGAGALAAVPTARGAEATTPPPPAVKASPLARKLADQHGVDLAQVKAAGGTIQKADVLAHVERRKTATAGNGGGRLATASPKARRLAAERGLDIRALRGSGPDGAVLAADVESATSAPTKAATRERIEGQGVSNVWRIMAERMTSSWTTAPHFFLVREVNVSRLASWLTQARKHNGAQISYTDLLIRLVAAAIAQHPRVNVSWKDSTLVQHPEITTGPAVAIADGLVVPVIHRADALTLAQLAERRRDVVARAQSGKLRPADIQGGTFTISNLGTYGIDGFSAIVNPPQAAILAVGRIADRVIAVNGQAVGQPTVGLTLSCDRRALDGARGAQFLGALADLIEEPLALLR